MTYGSPISQKVPMLRIGVGTSFIGTSVGKEGSLIRTHFDEFLKQYTFPYSRQETDLADPEIKFYKLKSEWENETAFLSSVSDICMHPSYQQIIGMGSIALPFIISELRKNPSHWFWALKAITGNNPIEFEHRGNIKAMADDWLTWYDQSANSE